MKLARNLALAVGALLATAAHAQTMNVKIGVMSDMSGLYADLGGPGSVTAAKLAIEDFNPAAHGMSVEMVTGDMLNKPDVGANLARQWYDSGVDMIVDVPNSGVALAVNEVAREKNKALLLSGPASSDLTGAKCSPDTIHWTYDTWMLANGTGKALVKTGGDTWFFITADYAFGHALERDTTAVVQANGGKVLGSVKHPLGASDFSSFLLQAQASKAQILGLADAGGDAINAIKAANEFGITKSMKLAGLLIFINDVHSLGLNLTQGMYLTTGWYWDMNPETRAWSKRYFEKMKKEPSMLQAADYSAASNYLKAVKALGTDDADKVMAYLKKTKINDMFTKDGVIRPDGRMVHDMYLMEVKKPSESKYPWDYYKVVTTVPGDQAYLTKAESKCALWK